jgi:hypothetical protein
MGRMSTSPVNDKRGYTSRNVISTAKGIKKTVLA